MSPSKELYELQEKEIEVDKCRDSLIQVKKQLEGDPALTRAEALVTNAKETLQTLRVQQEDMELIVTSLEIKIGEIDRKLYSGTTSNSKELMSFQDDSRMLNRQKDQQEEKLLDVMGKVEENERIYAEALKQFENAENGWIIEEKRLSAERENLDKMVIALESETGDLIKGIINTELKLFRTLQSTKGTAVAKVEQGICKGCGLTLPSDEFQKVRTSTELVRCSTCRRILIAT